LGCNGFVFDCSLGLKKFLPKLISFICLHHFLHRLSNLLWSGSALRDIKNTVCLISLLLSNNFNHFVELLGQFHNLAAVNLRHKVVQIVHYFVLKILQLFKLCIYLVKSVCSRIRFKQRVNFRYIFLLFLYFLCFRWLILYGRLLRFSYTFLLRSFLLALFQLWLVKVPLG
jgi:hypothetical protein